MNLNAIFFFSSWFDGIVYHFSHVYLEPNEMAKEFLFEIEIILIMFILEYIFPLKLKKFSNDGNDRF